MVVVANCGIECTVLFYCEFIVDLIDQFGFTKKFISSGKITHNVSTFHLSV